MKKNIILFATWFFVTGLTYYICGFFFDAGNGLFQINVATAIICETFLILGLPFLSSELVNFRSASSVRLVQVSVVTLWLWVAGYSLLSADAQSSLGTMVTGMAVIAVASVMLLGLTEYGGTVVEKQEEQLSSMNRALDSVRECADELWAEARSINCGKAPFLSSLRLLVEKVHSIPAARLGASPNEAGQIVHHLRHLKALCSTYAQSPDGQQLTEAITAAIDVAQRYVNHLK